MKVFFDTSAFVALENFTDARHDAALREFRRLVKHPSSLITSDFVFDETLTLLKRRAGSKVAIDWGKRMLHSQLFVMLPVGREQLEAALGIMEATQDQRFSFTDCSSFALMRASGITTAFGFDDDFVRFGFDQIPLKRTR